MRRRIRTCTVSPTRAWPFEQSPFANFLDLNFAAYDVLDNNRAMQIVRVRDLIIIVFVGQ